MSNDFMNELPAYYHNIREFQELSETVVKDWNKLDEALFGVEDDQFILTSSEAAITIREKDFGIRPDVQYESLVFRKLRLLARMQENAPQVLEYLIKILTDLFGENNHQIILDTDNYEMEVAIEVGQVNYYNEVVRIVERIVPLNIDLMTTILALRDCLMILSGTYGWNFSNRICGRFKTASKPAIIGKEQLSVRDESYTFLVSARTCGQFRAGGSRE